MFFDEGFIRFHLCWIERIDFGDLWGEVWVEFNGVVIGVMRGSWSWVFSEKTSLKSLHQLGITGSADWVDWVIWVEMVVLLIIPHSTTLVICLTCGKFSVCIQAKPM